MDKGTYNKAKVILKKYYEERESVGGLNLSNDIESHIKKVLKYGSTGVNTVLITLLVYKIVNPEQDIRYFKVGFKEKTGFNGLGFDTKYITPTLRELGLPWMRSGSGWYTRSLAGDPYFKENYRHNEKHKWRESFLEIIDYFQRNEKYAPCILKKILQLVDETNEENKVQIDQVNNKDSLQISKITELITEHFHFQYSGKGASVLPVLAIYAIYEIFIKELNRFKECKLIELKSHTASDKSSNSFGDIEIVKDKDIYEVVEIKHKVKIDESTIHKAYDKIKKSTFIERYYILSSSKVDSTPEMVKLIGKIRDEHGCELIVNGVIPTITYYLRVITSPINFLNDYIKLVSQHHLLKKTHKDKN